MKLVKLQSRLWNYMLLLVDVVFNTVKYREMRPRNLFPTFPVLYQRKVELHLFSGMLKSMSGNIKHDFLFAEKSIQTMYKGEYFFLCSLSFFNVFATLFFIAY